MYGNLRSSVFLAAESNPLMSLGGLRRNAHFPLRVGIKPNFKRANYAQKE